MAILCHRDGVATHQAGDRAADAGDPANLLPGLPEGPLPEHHILHRRVGPVLQWHLFGSQDGGLTWGITHAFPAQSIRHVHNVVYDRWADCLWIFTGDYGSECKIIRASLDFSRVDEIVAGNQQSRAVAAVITEGGIYFASDTPLEQNFIYLLDRGGKVHKIESISSSSIYGCRNRNGIFFSTMVEPSDTNQTDAVTLVGAGNGVAWEQIASWRKDRWSMRFFQYGNAFLPDGENTTDLLAASTIALEGADQTTTIWRTGTN